MSEVSVKARNLTTLSSPSSSSSTMEAVKSQKSKKKSLKRSAPDSSPDINDDELEVMFDKSSSEAAGKPSKSKKAKKAAASSDDSTVSLSEDVENFPPKPKKKKKKSGDDSSENKEKSKKFKKAADQNDDMDDSSVLEDIENMPPKPKKIKKKPMIIPSPSDSDDNSLEVIFDKSETGPSSSSKPKKSKADKKDEKGSSSILGDIKNLPSKPKKKKVTTTPKFVNTLEMAFAKSNPEKASKSKAPAKDDSEDATATISDASEVLPPKSKKKKAVDGEKSLKPKKVFDSSTSEDEIAPPKPKKKKSTENGVKEKKPLKSKEVLEGDDNSVVLEDTEALPPKPKKKKKLTEIGDKEKPQKKSKKVVEENGDDDSVVLEDTEALPSKHKKKKKKTSSSEDPMEPGKSDAGPSSSKPKKKKKSTDNNDKEKPKKSKKLITDLLPKLKPTDSSPPKSASKKDTGITPSGKKSTQQSIFGFCTVKSPVVPVVNEKEKAKELYDDAVNALQKGQHFSFKQAILAAQKLSESAIEAIDSECFKFAVLKNRKNNFDYDENENYQKYEQMLQKFSRNICEDTSIPNSKGFPDLKYAAENNEHYNLFGSCLEISQFFAAYPTFLDTTLKFSAEELLNAVTSGAEGYYKLTGEILAEFMHAFSTYDWFKGYKFLSANLKDITWNANTASEICKFFLFHELSPSTRDITKALDDKLHDLIKGNQADLKQKLAEQNLNLPQLDEDLAEEYFNNEFHALLPDQQLAILQHLIELFMTDYFFTRQFDAEECKVIPQEKIDALKKDLHELQVNYANSKRTEKRKRDDETKADPYYFRKKKTLENQIRNAERRPTLNKLHTALKPLPVTLGYDRFHRRYYIFPNSPNQGIYIEEFCQVGIDEETEFENDPIATELERYIAESARIPMKVSQWYHVTTPEEFEEIKKCLTKKGIRENVLFEAIEQNEAIISAALTPQPQLRDLKFKENESELGILKAVISKVLDKAEKYSFIHFSQKYDEMIDRIVAAKDFVELRDTIVSTTSGILPCAYPPNLVGQKYFRFTCWLRFAELCCSYSQMHALLLILHDKIRTDKLFGSIACPRCDGKIETRIAKNFKIIACVSCYGFIHFKCHDKTTEADPSPSEPLWICENCKKPEDKADEEKEEKKEEGESDEEDIIEVKTKNYVVGNKVLRSTRARERKEDTESVTSSSRPGSSRASSRNSEWENKTTRSLRPRGNKNYCERNDASFFEEKHIRQLRSKNLAPPPPIKEEKVVDAEILERYNQFCADYRILTSLRPLKFDALDYSNMTLDILNTKLHKFKKVRQLDDAIGNLMKVANSHFKTNARKFNEIQRHFNEFFGFEDVSDNDEDESGGSDIGDDSDIEIIDKKDDDNEDGEDEQEYSDIEIIE